MLCHNDSVHQSLTHLVMFRFKSASEELEGVLGAFHHTSMPIFKVYHPNGCQFCGIVMTDCVNYGKYIPPDLCRFLGCTIYLLSFDLQN